MNLSTIQNWTNVEDFMTSAINVGANYSYNPKDGMNMSVGTHGELNTSVAIPEPASTETVILLSLLFCIIDAIGLIGNCLVIIVILLDRKMRHSVTNIFIMNLATADFIIMLIGVPEIVQFMMNRGWLLGPLLCKINRFTLVVSLYGSIMSLVSVCIERFVAIVYPLKAHIVCGRKKIVIAILLIWPVSIGFGLPTLMYNQLMYPHPAVPYKHCMLIFPQKEYGVVFEYVQLVVFYMIPVVVQVVLYAVIGSKLYASTEDLHARFQMRSDYRVKQSKTSDTMKARRDVVKMLASSVLVYILCYAPPQILLLHDTFAREPFQVTWSFRVFSIIVSNVNSAANPILYSIFSQNFRKNFKKYLCFLCLHKRREYQRTGQESLESRIISRKIRSMSRSTIYTKV